jgi:hypothetical protein
LHGFGSWIPKPQPQNREVHEPPTRPTNSQLPCIDRTACYRLKPEPDADIPICRYAAKAQARSGPGARYGAVTESSAPPPGQVLIDLSRQNPWDGSWGWGSRVRGPTDLPRQNPGHNRRNPDRGAETGSMGTFCQTRSRFRVSGAYLVPNGERDREEEGRERKEESLDDGLLPVSP